MEITKYQNYKEFKERLDKNLEQQAAGFVEAGYLLKVARDTNILAESGYKTVAEFAQAEYGFTKDLVSRYIGINDKFSRDGYSEELDDKYKGFGFSKLAEMLSLPDSIIEEISPTLTRAQIQEVKKEVKEEEKISDIEVLMEERKEFENEVYAFMYYYLEGKKEIFDKLSSATSRVRQFEILAPNGSALLIARIPGTGKMMMKITDSEHDVVLTNVRTGDKKAYAASYIEVVIATSVFQRTYSVEYPNSEKEEVAPVQPKSEDNNLEAQENSTNNEPVIVPEEITTSQIIHGAIRTEQTEEQKYNTEQNRIDRDTKKILDEREDEEKMATLPSERPQTIHRIKIASIDYNDVSSGDKSFELRKNDRDYKVGDRLEMSEYKDGEPTGRVLDAEIVYILEDYKGLEDGYCILGIELIFGNYEEE